ncbi:MAG: hypothetical protein ACR2NP_21715, partial [Pirellulaceae bacterium]
MKSVRQKRLVIVCTISLVAMAQTGYSQTHPPVQLITDAAEFFEDGLAKEGYTHIGFERDALGAETPRDRELDVEATFVYAGARIRCLTHFGRVVVSGYKFRNSISEGRSLGNYFVDPETGKRISYQGVMRIDFCVPQDGTAGATVNKVGLFTEIVIPEHTIVEAYNASGHRIAVTQSTGERTSFMAFDSSQPISYLLVACNHYLDIEKLNKDFAIDDLVFDELVVDPGHRLVMESTVVRGDGTEETGEAAELGLPGLAWYHGRMPVDFRRSDRRARRIARTHTRDDAD